MPGRTTIYIIILCLFSGVLAAQNSEDIHLLSGIVTAETPPPAWKDAGKRNTNEIQSISSAFFLFYKTFLSSQDAAKCGFHPSCSEFAIDAVRKKGFFAGFLMGIDRYSRCNGFDRQYYDLHPESHLMLDPVTP